MYRFLFVIAILIGSVATAHAQGLATRTYCAYDYLRYCSAYSLSSPDLKKCMANVGVNLSERCIKALVDDGFITKQEVIDRAKKQGIVVVDGPNGLYVDKNAKVADEVKTVEIPAETVKAEDKPLVEDKNEVGTETKKVTAQISKTAKNVYNEVKTTVKKTTSYVKQKYKKVAKKNKEYASRPKIQDQNKIRREYVNGRNIAPEGINADFGRYKARPAGFVPPKPYNWKERQESRNIYSSGINGY